MAAGSGIGGAGTVSSLFGAMSLHTHPSSQSDTFASKIHTLLSRVFVSLEPPVTFEYSNISELVAEFKNALSEAKAPSSDAFIPEAFNTLWKRVEESQDETFLKGASLFLQQNYNAGISELASGLTELEEGDTSEPILEVDYTLLLSLCISYQGIIVDTYVENAYLSEHLLNLAQQHLDAALSTSSIDEESYSEAKSTLDFALGTR